LFFAAAVAECKRIPFDLPEAESELVSGYFTEYSGMKFGMFYFAEYMEVVTSSMLLVTIFLGGWQLPFLHRDGLDIAIGDVTIFKHWIPHIWMIIIGVVTFFGKTLAMCIFQAFVRWSLPRFRYDQLMKLGWRVMLPAAIGNVLVTGVIYLALDQAGEGVASGLRVFAQVTQAIVAVVLTVMMARGVIGLFSNRMGGRSLIGSSARYAAAAGGTKETPMQA
jgi:NADH-quinone oxidoreductase subunit H